MNTKSGNKKPVISTEKRTACESVGINVYFNRCICCPHFRKKSCYELHQRIYIGQYSLWCNERALEFFSSDEIKTMKVDSIKKIFERGNRQSVMWYLTRIAKEKVGWRGRRKFVDGECELLTYDERFICPHASDGLPLKDVYVGSFICRHHCVHSRDLEVQKRGAPVPCAYEYTMTLQSKLEELRNTAIHEDTIGAWLQFYLTECKVKKLLAI